MTSNIYGNGVLLMAKHLKKIGGLYYWYEQVYNPETKRGVFKYLGKATEDEVKQYFEQREKPNIYDKAGAVEAINRLEKVFSEIEQWAAVKKAGRAAAIRKEIDTLKSMLKPE
jgi:hypothetical protein